ncbi:UNVERIFIED_CONTAM: hypothetical protein NCL1_03091 [Trichonephila clavipes]
MERPAGCHRFPWQQPRSTGDDRPPARADGFQGGGMGNPCRLCLRVHCRAPDRVLRNAKIPRARPLGRLGEVRDP